MEKYKFTSQRVKKKRIITEGIESAAHSRIILFAIAALNLISSLVVIYRFGNNGFNMVILLYSLILIGLGFYSYKEPFSALLVGFILMVFIYVLMGIINPITLLGGLLLKIIFVSSFIYGLVKIKRAENVNAE